MIITPLSELVPEHEHINPRFCGRDKDDLHPLRLAENICPSALRYQSQQAATHSELAMTAIEMALAADHEAQARYNLTTADHVIALAREKQARYTDPRLGYGERIVEASRGLFGQRVAVKFSGELIDSTTIQDHARAMGALAYKLTQLFQDFPENSQQFRRTRTAVKNRTTATYLALINRSGDPERVAYPSSYRELSAESIYGHVISVQLPTGKQALSHKQQRQPLHESVTIIEPTALVKSITGRPQALQTAIDAGAFEPSIRTIGELNPAMLFNYSTQLLELEADPNNSLAAYELRILDALSGFMLRSLDKGTVIAQPA